MRRILNQDTNIFILQIHLKIITVNGKIVSHRRPFVERTLYLSLNYHKNGVGGHPCYHMSTMSNEFEN